MRQAAAKKWPPFLLLLLPLLTHTALSATALSAEEGRFSVQSATLHKQEGHWLLQAELNYSLSSAATEALKNGIPLTISTQFQLRKTRPWLWRKTVFNKTFLFQLRYHGLAKRYQVTDLIQNKQVNFATFQAAIDHLENLKIFPLKLPNSFMRSLHYWGRLQTTLEIEPLPLPLRPTAYLTPQWHLNSEWFEWPLNN
jgi:hypothetical protein